MAREKVFICSPFRAATHDEVLVNERLAKALCRQAFDLGKDPRAPHLFYTRFLEEETHGEDGRALALSWLRECDRLWRCQDVSVSAGMQAELDLANGLGIPVDIVSIDGHMVYHPSRF